MAIAAAKAKLGVAGYDVFKSFCISFQRNEVGHSRKVLPALCGPEGAKRATFACACVQAWRPYWSCPKLPVFCLIPFSFGLHLQTSADDFYEAALDMLQGDAALLMQLVSRAAVLLSVQPTAGSCTEHRS